MPGLVGLTDGWKSTLEPSLLVRNMARMIEHFDHYVTDPVYSADGVHACRTHPGIVQKTVQPFQKDAVAVWIYGEFYGVAQDSSSNSCGRDKPSDPEILADSYLNGHLFDFLKRVDGIFCAVIHDRDKKLIHLITDRYGLGRLFWTVIGDALIWASEPKAFLAHPAFRPVIDESAVADFFDSRVSYLRGDKTWFQGVEILSLGTVLTWDLRLYRVRRQQYWSWDDIPTLPEWTDPGEIIEELGRRFLRAVSKRCGESERIGLQLSGGLDSRAILAAVPNEGRALHAVTYGTPECADVRFARLAAHRKGAVHHVIELNADNWLDRRIDGVWYTDGELSFLTLFIQCALPLMHTLFDINLDGYLGDATIGGTYIDLHGTPEREHLADRGRRFIRLGSQLAQTYGHARLPFFDNDFLELAMSTPKTWRKDSALYNIMLLTVFPEFFGNIPWQKTGLPISVSSDFRNRDSPAWNSSFHRISEWIRNNPARALIGKILESKDALYPEWISRDRAAQDIAGLDAGEDRSDPVCRYLTLEIWLRQVYEGAFRPGLKTAAGKGR